jgi:hypothetical protein
VYFIIDCCAMSFHLYHGESSPDEHNFWQLSDFFLKGLNVTWLVRESLHGSIDPAGVGQQFRSTIYCRLMHDHGCMHRFDLVLVMGALLLLIQAVSV